MKVINEWDGEPARTPTQVIRDWYAAYKDEMNWGGIDGFHATELMAALAPLFAAGVWRYDVENAPKDGSEIAAEFDVLGTTERHFVKWHSGSGSWESPSEKLPDDALRAFATINQPEIPNA